EARDSQRYRARFGFAARLTDDLEFGLRLATGEGDPTSENLAFGERLSASDIRIDRAYRRWSAPSERGSVAGEMENPFFQAGETALMWDGDFDPQGLAASFEAGSLFGRAGACLLDYRADGVDSRLYAVQAGISLDVQDSTLRAGVGWF